MNYAGGKLQRHRTHRVGVLLYLCVLCVSVVSYVASATAPRQQGAPVTFSDITKQAGITFKHENGASAQKYLPETMSAGALIFDYDNDGWPDIFLVNGGSFVDRGAATAAQHRLYHNNRNGKFTDTTASSGIAVSGFG